MLPTNFLKVSLLAILSILILPTSSFSMDIGKKHHISKKTNNPTEILNDIYHEQNTIINRMLDSFRIVIYYYRYVKVRNCQYYKNEKKINALTSSIAHLNSKTKKAKKTISKILPQLTTQEKEKIEEIEETQKTINQYLSVLKHTKDEREFLRCMMNLKHKYTAIRIGSKIKPRPITQKLNICTHVIHTPGKGPRATIKNEHHCSLCDNNANNNDGCCFGRKTKITLCTACVIAGVILAVKLLR